MHFLMLLMMKLLVLHITLQVPLVKIVIETTKPRHFKAVERTVKIKCKASREMSVPSRVEEKRIIVIVVIDIKEVSVTEEVVEVCAMRRRAVKPASVSKLVVLPSLIFVT